MLIYSRLLYPGSKKRSYEKRKMFFERIEKLYSRDTSLVYYDVTNYYFEIDKQDDLRRKGYSKEHRRYPIVQMGLFLDTDGIPLTYGLYPGNILDKQTLIPMMHQVRKQYDLGRFIVVGD